MTLVAVPTHVPISILQSHNVVPQSSPPKSSRPQPEMSLSYEELHTVAIVITLQSSARLYESIGQRASCVVSLRSQKYMYTQSTPEELEPQTDLPF